RRDNSYGTGAEASSAFPTFPIGNWIISGAGRAQRVTSPPSAPHPDDPAAEPERARPEDHAEAARIAQEAGELLVEVRERMVRKGTTTGMRRYAGDRCPRGLIMHRLAERCPGDAVLSEEGVDRAERLGAEGTWIGDPLDGTREFGAYPRSDWAVHVAL